MPIKKAITNNRITVPLFVTYQDGSVVGVYVIGVSNKGDVITKINGINASLKRIDETNIEIAFNANDIWSNCVYICKKSFLSE